MRTLSKLFWSFRILGKIPYTSYTFIVTNIWKFDKNNPSKICEIYRFAKVYHHEIFKVAHLRKLILANFLKWLVRESLSWIFREFLSSQKFLWLKYFRFLNQNIIYGFQVSIQHCSSNMLEDSI